MKSRRTKELRALHVHSLMELQEKCDGYFASCKKQEISPTLLGLCRWLDVDRETLLFMQFEEQIDHILTQAKTTVEAALEEELIKNPKNANAIIFLLKVNFGWGEKEKENAQGEDTIVVELGE